MPYLEAVAAGRPLIAAGLPNVVPDLKAFGFDLPHLYDEVYIDPSLLDMRKECLSDSSMSGGDGGARFRVPVARWPKGPSCSDSRRGIPRPSAGSTLSGQLEALAIPPEESLGGLQEIRPRSWRSGFRKPDRATSKSPAGPRLRTNSSGARLTRGVFGAPRRARDPAQRPRSNVRRPSGSSFTKDLARHFFTPYFLARNEASHSSHRPMFPQDPAGCRRGAAGRPFLFGERFTGSFSRATPPSLSRSFRRAVESICE